MVCRIKFTKSTLTHLASEGKAFLVADSEVPGLKLKVHPKPKHKDRLARKTFLLEKRIKGRKGSAVTFTLGTFPNMPVDQARQKARHYANLCEQGKDPRQERGAKSKHRRVTLSEMAQRFFEIHEVNLAPRTAMIYKNHLRLYFGHWMNRDLHEITADDLVEKYQVDITRSKAGALIAFKLLGNMWNRTAPFIREGGKRILPESPIPMAKRLIGKWKKDPPKRPVIPLHKLGEFVAILEKRTHDATYAEGKRTNLEVLLTCLFCGFRHGECRSLRWEAVNLEVGIITIGAKHAKNRQEHHVPVSDYIQKLLQWRYDQRNPLNPYVFPSPFRVDKPIHPRWGIAHRLSKKLGFPFSPHATRRTFATIGNYLGLPLLTLKRLINHHYEGGVTGGYVVPGFDPTVNRKHFQAIADFILEKCDEYLGVKDTTAQTKLKKLQAYAQALGIDREQALEAHQTNAA